MSSTSVSAPSAHTSGSGGAVVAAAGDQSKETKGLSENDRALKKRQGAEGKRQGAEQNDHYNDVAPSSKWSTKHWGELN